MVSGASSGQGRKLSAEADWLGCPGGAMGSGQGLSGNSHNSLNAKGRNSSNQQAGVGVG